MNLAASGAKQIYLTLYLPQIRFQLSHDYSRALSCFTTGVSSGWTHFTRSSLKDCFDLAEEIRLQFIDSILFLFLSTA